MNKPMETAMDYQKWVTINTGKQEVFDALTRGIDHWWGKVDQPAVEPGDIFKISFGEGSYWRFKVVGLAVPQTVTWECVESHQDHHIAGIDKEWLGSKLYWEIYENENGTEVRLLHQGLVPSGVCYSVCANAWDFYIADSLKNYLEKGEGKPGEM